jgi:tRNA-splicing ligase RtcB
MGLRPRRSPGGGVQARSRYVVSVGYRSSNGTTHLWSLRYCLSSMIETFADGKVRSWASILDDVTRAQAAETASLSIISAPIALMPDAHLGAGATIGTVLVTENALIPMAVGVDIGCGMAARKLQLRLDDFRDTGAHERHELRCVDPPPPPFGRLDQLEAHRHARLPRAGTLRDVGPGPHRCERRLDGFEVQRWIQCSAGKS